MRNKVIAVFSTLTVLIGLGWYSLVHAQTAEMARHEPHMSAALGHLQEANRTGESCSHKGGHRERQFSSQTKPFSRCTRESSISRNTTSTDFPGAVSMQVIRTAKTSAG